MVGQFGSNRKERMRVCQSAYCWILVDRTRPKKVGRYELWVGRTLFLGLMTLTLLPFLSIFLTALHPSGSVPSGMEWPDAPQWGNFVEAFKVANMNALLVSSSYIVLAVVPISLLIATMAAFAIGLLRIPGASILLLLFVFGLTLPFGGIIVPLYYLERAMGLYNTRLAIVLPLIALYMPFAVFWMRAHFVNMPAEISEAARIDGATIWDLFWRIHLPLARSPIASLGILLSIWTWNQFLLALVLVEDPTQRTMAGALGAFQSHYATDVPLLCAGTMLILLPTFIIFVLFQRQIITALIQGAVKG
jgi:raffinose/stachyose/melibiose transport system permease protein